MDNASNCDALAWLLPNYLPDFRGMQSQGHCFPHIINLIAKIFISFFFKQVKQKKSVTVAAGTHCQHGATATAPSDTEFEEEVLVIEEGEDINFNSDDSDNDNAAVEESEITESTTLDDNGKDAHNDLVVKSLADKAIKIMWDEYSIVMKPEEQQYALQIFPRMAGLSHHVHDSTTLKEKFDEMVENNPLLSGGQHTLTRRVPTRRNSDCACLESHLHFKKVVKELTSVPSNGLKAFELSPKQWAMAADVLNVLQLFNDFTNLFSQSEVPLIVDAVPMLETLENSLIAVRDDDLNTGCSTVIRVAAQASLLLICKYSIFTTDCELYHIAIVQEIQAIKSTVVKCWKEKYKKYQVNESPDQAQTSEPAKKVYSSISILFLSYN
ncbi:hypothetical protein BDQ12DRAFT_696742 [Crucibulum laeve]|uniref:Uncharacterized protein n=1 Tax=Crucibulum laeve TaxID=68775 RepID=A0A5C3MCJ1_9AGAR|nr:hypothetical protein BDQ12DRAFT_696742 [Crucibulum laeve]